MKKSLNILKLNVSLNFFTAPVLGPAFTFDCRPDFVKSLGGNCRPCHNTCRRLCNYAVLRNIDYV